MWKGWNSQIVTDELPVQVVGYQKSINASITRNDVVNKTLEIANQVRIECKEDYMLTGYDLQAAKQAYRIQDKEAPVHDKLFIKVGGMHFRMSWYSSLGYFISDSGLPYVLLNSEILGTGSLNGFLKGKHYNRCERIHTLLYTALSELHIERFKNDSYSNGKLPGEVSEILLSFSQNPGEIIEGVSNPQLVKLVKKYEKYCEDTRAGKLGKTAQFAMLYMDMIHDKLILDRAIRTNDADLYTYAMEEMVPVTWSGNRPNYKRWGVKELLRYVYLTIIHTFNSIKLYFL